jgi:hypothetical protein
MGQSGAIYKITLPPLPTPPLRVATEIVIHGPEVVRYTQGFLLSSVGEGRGGGGSPPTLPSLLSSLLLLLSSSSSHGTLHLSLWRRSTRLKKIIRFLRDMEGGGREGKGRSLERL